MDEGCIGDLVVLEAREAGLAGVLVWGTHRDSRELLTIGFPVFSYGTCPMGPRRLEQRAEGALERAHFGDHEVTTAEVVFADADGAIFLPRAAAGEVVAVARQIREVERQQAERVVSGDSLAASAKRNRTTVDAIKRLNGLTGDVIRPGLTLKVLNQPIAVFVDKREFLLWATYGGQLLAVMPCGIGKQNRTSPGTYRISERIKDPVWYPTDGRPSIPPGDPENLLGSRWLGFKDSGLGIHEATNADDIGKESSNGCIRLAKEDVELLFDLVPENTPVTIME